MIQKFEDPATVGPSRLSDHGTGLTVGITNSYRRRPFVRAYLCPSVAKKMHHAGYWMCSILATDLHRSSRILSVPNTFCVWGRDHSVGPKERNTRKVISDLVDVARILSRQVNLVAAIRSQHECLRRPHLLVSRFRTLTKRTIVRRHRNRRFFLEIASHLTSSGGWMNETAKSIEPKP